MAKTPVIRTDRVMQFSVTILVFLAACVRMTHLQDAQPADPQQSYVAFRSREPVEPARREALLRDAVAAGLKPVETSALKRESIFVFETPDAKLRNTLDRMFSAMLRVPVREFQGVLSVSTGFFYLQFKDQVPLETVRTRLLDAGFRIVTPDPQSGALLVVTGTRLPENRDRELSALKNLQDLLYVAPDDIPLPTPAK